MGSMGGMGGNLARLIVLPGLLLLRLVSGGLLALALGALAGSGALAIGGAVFGLTSRHWIVPVATAAALIIGAVAAKSWLMPGTAELIREPAPGEALPTPVIVALALLVVLTTLQVPAVVTWWDESLSLLRHVTGSARDPSGFSLVPAVVIGAAPALASGALLVFVVSSIVAVAAPAAIAPRLLGACLMLQGGLIGAHFAVERGVRELAAVIRTFVDRSPDPELSARIGSWLTQYDQAAAAIRPRLLWLLAGSVLSVLLAARRRQPRPEADLPATIAAPPVPAPARVTPPAAGHPSTDFDETAYTVRPRMGLLGVLAWRHAEYDIDAIPPSSRSHFRFSWRTGTMRRQPDGPDLLSVVSQRDLDTLGRKSYVVGDSQRGVPIGTLVPSGSDWDIRDASGAGVARVLELERGAGRARYVATAGDQEICRYVWGFAGLTAASAELQIEFLPGTSRLHKGLTMALGPILEDRSRRSSRWHS